MTQDTFNKIVTIVLFTFFMIMYVISFLTGKVIDWNSLLVFIVPTLNHIMSQYTQAQVTTKTIDAKSQKDVALITATGANGTPAPLAAVAAPKGGEPRG